MPAVALGLGAACSRAALPALMPVAAPFAADSMRTTVIGPGLSLHSYWTSHGPWAVSVLAADRAACWQAVAIKAGDQAVGRSRTSALVGSWTGPDPVGGGVNADFFAFAPPGVPTGAHVTGGRVLSGPSERPVLAFDAAGRPWIGTLATAGMVRLGAESVPLAAWNQRRGRGLRIFDRGWGRVTDSAAGVEVALGGRPLRVLEVDTARAGIVIPPDGFVILADSTAGASRDLLRRIRPGTPAAVRIGLQPFAPREAVGGFPVLVADSQVVAGLDSAGGRNFGPVRHPRTAAGIAAGGRRLLLVVVDGRQQPYSDGMTLRELADLMRSLGASSAINLDGGGSTTMVAGLDSLRIVNRPSDAAGERPVANALGLVRRCEPGTGAR
ncbi:MAG: phosphodiester glycosidase family protein [Gemmatimonadales bacterium]